MNKPLVLAALASLVAALAARRRQAQVDADTLWREATSDSSR
ncbi:DLW-39 family protein [uncultured Jatrophihabitans sp.]